LQFLYIKCGKLEYSIRVAIDFFCCTCTRTYYGYRVTVCPPPTSAASAVVAMPSAMIAADASAANFFNVLFILFTFSSLKISRSLPGCCSARCFPLSGYRSTRWLLASWNCSPQSFLTSGVLLFPVFYVTLPGCCLSRALELPFCCLTTFCRPLSAAILLHSTANFEDFFMWVVLAKLFSGFYSRLQPSRLWQLHRIKNCLTLLLLSQRIYTSFS